MALFQATRAGNTEVAAAVAGLLHSAAKLAPQQGPLAEALQDLPSQLVPMFIRLLPKQQRKSSKQLPAKQRQDAEAVKPITLLPAACQVWLQPASACCC